MINFHQSRPPGRLLDKGDKVECINASGTGLTRGAIYVIADTSDCPMCGGGVTLTAQSLLDQDLGPVEVETILHSMMKEHNPC